jgi:hypothetical protein
MTNSEKLITEEVEKLTVNTKRSLDHVKTMAIDEAWKLLQIVTATIIQIIESIGQDLSGADKKKLAMDLISNFYDKVFIVINIPYFPNVLEAYIHKYVKQFLMVLVSSTIDSMVTIFRNTGVFLKKQQGL